MKDLFNIMEYCRLPFNCIVKLLRFAALQADCSSKMNTFQRCHFLHSFVGFWPVSCAISLGAISVGSCYGLKKPSRFILVLMHVYRLILHE